MARPERNNVDYFPYDCKDGKKMYYIEETYGNDGFATFVKLLRELASADNHFLNLNEKSTLMYLAAKCKVSTELLEKIVVDLVELEKFDFELWTACRVIWCQDFVDSIADAYRKRTNECITKAELINYLESIGAYKQKKKPESLPAKTTIKKGPIIPSEIEFLDHCKTAIPSQFQALEFAIISKFQSWVAQGWKDGNGKPIKNWKTKINNTLPYLKPMYNGQNATNNAQDRNERDSKASEERMLAKLENDLQRGQSGQEGH